MGDDDADTTDIGDIFGHDDSSELVQDWQPSGQAGLADAIGQAHSASEEEQMKADGLKGHDILGSTGMASAPTGQDDDADTTDIGDIFGHDDSGNADLELLQEEASKKKAAKKATSKKTKSAKGKKTKKKLKKAVKHARKGAKKDAKLLKKAAHKYEDSAARARGENGAMAP